MFQDFTDDTTDKSVLAARLTQLRRQLKQQKLDGFLVPREDAFQGEYVPAANERLKYMTGFGGSAGMAIILAKKAALFVDGRYELQAPQQKAVICGDRRFSRALAQVTAIASGSISLA